MGISKKKIKNMKKKIIKHKNIFFLKNHQISFKNIKNYVSLDSSFRGTYGGEHIPSG